MVRTRFAPSPTGYVHVGNLRTALFEYLFARKNKGVFVVRVEDTDQTRQVEGAVESMLETLAWVGITPDEGPMLNEKGEVVQQGNFGPYVQSERLEIYKKYAQVLLDKGFAYYAFDTAEELEEMRTRQQAMKLPPKYERLVMKNEFTLGETKTNELLTTDTPRVIRLKIPDTGSVSFNDRIRGSVSFNVGEIDDQVLLKSDGFPTYHLAVVVDDHLMDITHVIRGEDWLPSTPKHILLYQAFGWTQPEFAHLPLLVSADKKKLSKRQGDVSVESYREKGYLPEALVNFIAFLGWNPGDDREIFTLTELIETFSLERVQLAAAVFNTEKLDWHNKQHISRLDLDELTKRSLPFLKQAGLVTEVANNEQFEWLKKAVALERERIATLAELPAALGFLFNFVAAELTNNPEILVWKKSTREETTQVFEGLMDLLNTIPTQDWAKEKLDAVVGEWITTKGYGVGNVLWPLRVALSGQKNSPGPYEIADVLGKEKTLERVLQASKLLK